MGASFVCGTDRNPPVNPILEYAVDELKLKLVPKFRDGPNANVFYDRYFSARLGQFNPGV